MLKCKLISTGTKSNLEELKIAALYYDEIDVLKNIVYTLTPLDIEGQMKIRGAHECFDKAFNDNLKLLKKEKIASIEETIDVRLKPADPKKMKRFVEPSELDTRIFEESQKLIKDVGNKLWETQYSEGKISRVSFNKEAELIHKIFINELKVGAKVDFEFLQTYYSNLLFYNIKFMHEGENVVNTSDVIDNYFKSYHQKNLNRNAELFKTLGKPNIGLEAIKYFVPNVSKLSIEDILEIRIKLKDELENYRYYVAELNKNIGETENMIKTEEEVNFYLENKINPALKDLKTKLLASKLSIAHDFLNEIKDPKSYTPMIGNILLDISAHISLLLSIGLIGTSTYLKWKEKGLETKNNGLYYLLKLNNKT